MDISYPCPSCGAMMPFDPDSMRAHRFMLGHEVRLLICEPCPNCKANIVLANILEYDSARDNPQHEERQPKASTKAKVVDPHKDWRDEEWRTYN